MSVKQRTYRAPFDIHLWHFPKLLAALVSVVLVDCVNTCTVCLKQVYYQWGILTELVWNTSRIVMFI